MLTDFQNVCTVGKRMKFATNPYDITHLTLGTLLHYLGKLKMQIFCSYLAHRPMEENANKLYFYRLYLFIQPQISIFSVFKIASFPHTNCK